MKPAMKGSEHEKQPAKTKKTNVFRESYNLLTGKSSVNPMDRKQHQRLKDIRLLVEHMEKRQLKD